MPDCNSIRPEWTMLWLAAAFSETVESKEWQNWADNLIINCENVPNWIYEVSTAATIEDLQKAFVLANREVWSGDSENWLVMDLALGFLYLRYERGDLGLGALLSRAACLSDRGSCTYDPEWFYMTINGLESGRIKSIQAEAALMDKIKPAIDRARIGWSQILALDSPS